MKSATQRAEERRQEQLDEIQRQVEQGTLVIRKMTPEERKKFPPRADKSGGSRSGRRRR